MPPPIPRLFFFPTTVPPFLHLAPAGLAVLAVFCFLPFFRNCCSLRNKRPDLSGRPPCKGVAMGVARRGGRLGGERTLRVPPCCSFPVSHSGGPHVVSFVTGRRSCSRGARVRAGVARHAAESVRASWRGKACRKKALPKRFPAFLPFRHCCLFGLCLLGVVAFFGSLLLPLPAPLGLPALL